jgi:ribosome-binding factor A
VGTRQAKVEEALKVEISEIVQREMKDPRIGFVTITGVEITADLRSARVFISVMAEAAEKQKNLKALNSAAGYVRSELGKRLRMRTIPELEFKLDTSIEEGIHMFELLQKIKKNETPNEPQEE